MGLLVFTPTWEHCHASNRVYVFCCCNIRWVRMAPKFSQKVMILEMILF